MVGVWQEASFLVYLFFYCSCICICILNHICICKFALQSYLGGCLARGISSGEPSPGLARALSSYHNCSPVFPWNYQLLFLEIGICIFSSVGTKVSLTHLQGNHIALNCVNVLVCISTSCICTHAFQISI